MKLKFLLSTFFAALLVVQPCLSNHADGQDTPRRIEVTAKRFSFTPGDITLKKGEPVAFVLTSEDVPHGLRFKELGVDIKAAKGRTTETTFTPEKTGDFVGHCSVFCGSGHGGMTLTLHVVE